MKDVETLYGMEHGSFNVHLLTHLAVSVITHGRLWTHSAFVYENFHQELKEFVKSSNAANLQILKSFRAKLAFKKLHKLYSNDLTIAQKHWLNKLLKKTNKAQASLIIGNVKLIGKAEEKNLLDEYYLAFKRINIILQRNCPSKFYKRIITDKELIVSKEYTKVKKRNSYTVILTNNEMFEIKIFVVVKQAGERAFYALGDFFQRVSNPWIPGRKLDHITVVKKTQINDVYAAINVDIIKHKVNVVQLQDEEIIIACMHPNRFELLTSKLCWNLNGNHYYLFVFLELIIKIITIIQKMYLKNIFLSVLTKLRICDNVIMRIYTNIY